MDGYISSLIHWPIIRVPQWAAALRLDASEASCSKNEMEGGRVGESQQTFLLQRLSSLLMMSINSIIWFSESSLLQGRPISLYLPPSSPSCIPLSCINLCGRLPN